MAHPLQGRLPDDAPWAKYTVAVLKRECGNRNLPRSGTKQVLIDRLVSYTEAHASTSATKRHHPWLAKPISDLRYTLQFATAMTSRMQILPRYIVDEPDIMNFILVCPESYHFQIAFMPSELRTIFQHSRLNRILGGTPQESQAFICHLCFRDTDHGTEPPIYCKECKRGVHSKCNLEADFGIRSTTGGGATCLACDNELDWDVENFGWKDRVLPIDPNTTSVLPAQAGQNPGAIQEGIQGGKPEDENANQIQSTKPGVSSSSSSSSAFSEQTQHLPDTVNHQESSPAQSSREITQTDNSGQHPGNPALIEKEMHQQHEREQQQVDKAQQPVALLEPAANLGDVLSKTPHEGGQDTQATTFDNAAKPHISAQASSSSSQDLTTTASTVTPQLNQTDATSTTPAADASVADSVPQSQSPQVDATTPAADQPAAATDAQVAANTLSSNNSIVASTPVPPNHSASSPSSTPAPSATSSQINTIDKNTKALALVQECSRLAKESVEIRKKSEREAKRTEKKYWRQLKKMIKTTKAERKKHRQELNRIKTERKKLRQKLKRSKRKSQQEIKELEKRIESLEKEILKALGSPAPEVDMAEGDAA
ncbi:hypothetical protein B0T20DRAFT_461408 [Sordaria brevicollis]|uniref:SAP domain-containing protein n=1 Tax=Sordaria brevicollis TaxID=83679 RepID=A0AAE0UCK5_SORBR|nr:hypothetical protein B0T20DRAFT_461408 [Sordaria brevicollis]